MEIFWISAIVLVAPDPRERSSGDVVLCRAEAEYAKEYRRSAHLVAVGMYNDCFCIVIVSRGNEHEPLLMNMVH